MKNLIALTVLLAAAWTAVLAKQTDPDVNPLPDAATTAMVREGATEGELIAALGPTAKMPVGLGASGYDYTMTWTWDGRIGDFISVRIKDGKVQSATISQHYHPVPAPVL